MLPRLDRALRDVEIFADKLARHPNLLGIGGAVRPSSGVKETHSVFRGANHWQFVSTTIPHPRIIFFVSASLSWQNLALKWGHTQRSKRRNHPAELAARPLACTHTLKTTRPLPGMVKSM
jgi:hypothetical protein